MGFESPPERQLKLPLAERLVTPYKKSPLYQHGQREGTRFHISPQQTSILDNLAYQKLPINLTINLLHEDCGLIATHIAVERINEKEEGRPSRYLAYILEESIPLPVYLIRQGQDWSLEFDF